MFWGDLYDHLMDTKTFTLMMNRIFIGALKIMRKMATASIWILQWYKTFTIWIFTILLTIVHNHWRPIYLTLESSIMLKSPALLWGHYKHKMSFSTMPWEDSQWKFAQIMKSLLILCGEKWTHTYLPMLRYALLNWSAKSKISRTRKALLERVMAIPCVCSLSDCSSTTAFSPTLLQSTKNNT